MAAVEEIQIVREAATRVGAEILAMGVGPDGRARGRVRCRDGWHAARFLVALGDADRRRGWSLDMARRMRAMTSAAGRTNDWAFVAYAHASVQNRIRFRRETGEIFAGPQFTWNCGVGDCDDHARLLYAILAAGGVPVRLAFLYREWSEGPAHVCVQAFYDGAWHWCETTVAAELGEEPYAAAARLGILNARSDIARQVTTMSESDLPPVPAGFDARTSPAQLERDARALNELGYLCDASGITVPDDPRFRVAVQAFQRARNLKPDGLIGPITRGDIGALVPWYARRIGAIAGTSRAFGVDVASPQGPNVDFARARDAGVEFAIVQLTRGRNVRDPGGIDKVRAASAAGLVVAPYHFAILTTPPEEQAAFFVAAIRESGVGVSMWALDLEHVDPATMLSPIGGPATIDWALRFVRAVKAEIGGAALLYSYPSYLSRAQLGGDVLERSSLHEETALWIADYSKGPVPSDDAQPNIPPNTWKTWAFWQTHGDDNKPPGSGAPRIPGFGDAVDHDVFNGTIEDLRGGAVDSPPGVSSGGGASIAGLVFLGLAAAGLVYAFRS